MIGIANRTSGYDENWIDYLQPFLSNCGNIIKAYRNDKRRLQAENLLREQYQRTLLLKEITEEIRFSFDTTKIFQTTVNRLGDALKVNRCVIHLYLEEPIANLPCVAEYLNSPLASMLNVEIPIEGNPHAAKVLELDKAIVSNNVFIDPLLESATHLCEKLQIKSMLAVRTSYQGKPNGIIAIHQCDAFRAWSTDEIELLEAVAAQVGRDLLKNNLPIILGK